MKLQRLLAVMAKELRQLARDRITLAMIVRSRAPAARAPITNSRSRNFRNSARVSRAMPVQLVSPIAATTVDRLGEKTATTTIAKTRLGSTWKNSVTPISKLSILPPKNPASAPTVSSCSSGNAAATSMSPPQSIAERSSHRLVSGTPRNASRTGSGTGP